MASKAEPFLFVLLTAAVLCTASACIDKEFPLTAQKADARTDLTDAQRPDESRDGPETPDLHPGDLPDLPADATPDLPDGFEVQPDGHEVTDAPLDIPLDAPDLDDELFSDVDDDLPLDGYGDLPGELPCTTFICGDLVCSSECGESQDNCLADCCPAHKCGDGKCKAVAGCNETVLNCPADCCICGDGTCHPECGEDLPGDSFCAADCES
jgi:hypothetical protein